MAARTPRGRQAGCRCSGTHPRPARCSRRQRLLGDHVPHQANKVLVRHLLGALLQLAHLRGGGRAGGGGGAGGAGGRQAVGDIRRRGQRTETSGGVGSAQTSGGVGSAQRHQAAWAAHRQKAGSWPAGRARAAAACVPPASLPPLAGRRRAALTASRKSGDSGSGRKSCGCQHLSTGLRMGTTCAAREGHTQAKAAPVLGTASACQHDQATMGGRQQALLEAAGAAEQADAKAWSCWQAAVSWAPPPATPGRSHASSNPPASTAPPRLAPAPTCSSANASRPATTSSCSLVALCSTWPFTIVGLALADASGAATARTGCTVARARRGAGAPAPSAQRRGATTAPDSAAIAARCSAENLRDGMRETSHRPTCVVPSWQSSRVEAASLPEGRSWLRRWRRRRRWLHQPPVAPPCALRLPASAVRSADHAGSLTTHRAAEHRRHTRRRCQNAGLPARRDALPRGNLCESNLVERLSREQALAACGAGRQTLVRLHASCEE